MAIRVMIVDDSVVVRRMLNGLLSSDPVLQVVCTAANGKIALERIPQVNPDIIILDVEMPEMDGLQTLKAIRSNYGRVPVIMFSTLTRRGAEVTLDALALGANDYLTKPSTSTGAVGALGALQDELIRRIKIHCRQEVSSELVPAPAVSAPGSNGTAAGIASAPRNRGAAEVIAIAASTGGPNALMELFSSLPAELAVPVLIVQHMPPLFTRLFGERLSATGRIPVQEGRPGAVVEPGAAWIAPGDYHMLVRRVGTAICIQTNREPQENSCRPAADVLFRSVAEVYGKDALAVVMTGMGQDGLRGCEAIRKEGGQILAQDEASSVVWGMPGFVARAGLADDIVPLNEMVAEIMSRVRVRTALQRREPQTGLRSV